MFANDPEDQGSIPDRVTPNTQNMVLDIALLNTQASIVRIKDKVEQSIFINPSAWTGYDTRAFLAGFNRFEF